VDIEMLVQICAFLFAVLGTTFFIQYFDLQHIGAKAFVGVIGSVVSILISELDAKVAIPFFVFFSIGFAGMITASLLEDSSKTQNIEAPE
jgi:hypothetical protein